MVSQELYRNDLFISLLWNPAVDKTEQLVSFFQRLGKAKKTQSEPDEEAIRKLEELSQNLMQGLEEYGVRLLSIYEHEGILFSEQSEFLHQLVGEDVSVFLSHLELLLQRFTRIVLFLGKKLSKFAMKAMNVLWAYLDGKNTLLKHALV